MGGFGAAYDLVSSEYGWTDKEIGDLPLARFRQITAAIQTRKFADQRQDNARFSWLARNLAGFIAAGYMVAEGTENTALKHASSLAMDDIEAALLGRTPTEGPDAHTNANGSYEKFMMTLGATGGRRG